MAEELEQYKAWAWEQKEQDGVKTEELW